MDDLQSELLELKQFIADLKADRAATKEKERREAWTKYVSLTVVIIAVIAAIAGQWSGKYGSRVLTQLNDATFNQTQASDQWAYYQSKSIKQKAYDIGRDQLAQSGATPEQLKKYEEASAKYKKEQDEITAKAKVFEDKRDLSRLAASKASEQGGKMGLSISFFSVSIAMASICLVTKKKPLWIIAIVLALVAVWEMLEAWGI